MADPFIGEISLFTYNFAPSGYCLCNGQSLNSTQNAALFSLIGYTYGKDSSNPQIFKVPNLQGSAAVGQGTAPGGATTWKMADHNGSETVTITFNTYPSHTHILAIPAGAAVNSYIPASGAAMAGTVPAQYFCQPPAQANLTLNAAMLTAYTGGGQAHENRQPFLVLLPCIALEGEYPQFS